MATDKHLPAPPILGFDIHDDPIRVGDTVICVGANIKPQYRQAIFRVIGIDEYVEKATQLLPSWAPYITLDNGKFVSARSVRRLTQASWDDVRAVTGWRPRVIPLDPPAGRAS